MKFSALALALVVSQVSAETCLNAGTSIEANGCSVGALSGALKDALPQDCGHDVATEIRLMVGVADDAQAAAAVSKLCAAEWKDYQTTNFLNFDDIADDEPGQQFTQAFYEGGTNWNDLRKTTDLDGNTKYELAEYPGKRVRSVHSNEAQNGGITFPDNTNNFQECDLRTVMCCWVRDRQAGDDNGNCKEDNCFDKNPGDNTNVCYVDMERSGTSPNVQSGFALYENGSEGATHCHGLAWAADDNDLISQYKGNNLFFVSMYDHLTQRGYVNEVPGAPMCGCIEKMPVVERSDCTQVDVTHTATFSYDNDGLSVALADESSVVFNACQVENNNNDLEAYYELLVEQGRATAAEKEEFSKHIVGNGNCPEVTAAFMASKGFTKAA